MANNKKITIKNPPYQRGIFYLYLIAVFFSFPFSGIAQAAIKFTESKKSFGFVQKGEIVSLDYEFVNNGNEPLIITDAKFECSCTSVDYPKQPIPPSQTSKITVKFDTKNAYDRQDRIVEIISNAGNSPAKIRFKGFVKRK